nr:ribonuclease H-like domain-containing protein [Tanacetum cinerariifolium]
MHTRASNFELVKQLPEPEHTLNQRLRRQNRRVSFDQRNNPPQHRRIVYPPILNINFFRHFLDILLNYNPIDEEPMWAADRVVALTPGSAITIPETTNEFAIKGNHLTLIKGNQFDDRTKTDPHKHIHEFLRICDMFKYRDTKKEVVRLMMFPLSLTRESKTCLDELNEGTIETWDEFRTDFISRFFPSALFDRLLGEIRAFSQLENESLTDAWLQEIASRKERVSETYDYRSQYDAYEYDTYHANYNIEIEYNTMYRDEYGDQYFHPFSYETSSFFNQPQRPTQEYYCQGQKQGDNQHFSFDQKYDKLVLMIETNKEVNRRYKASFAAHDASFKALETHVDRLLDQLNKDDSYELQVMKIPLLEYFPTASEEVIPLLSQKDAPTEEVFTAKKLRINHGQRHIYISQRLTTEDMQKRRNDVKARTTLLLALLDEHQLRFSKYKTAQELWGAILKTFGGNEATKKTKKNQLKQQYGNFKVEGDLDTMSLDDPYNHLKVYEPEVQKKPESNSHNMAFISSAKNSSGKGEVNTASIPTASTHVSPASADVTAASISLDTVCAYIASQSNGSQIKYEDINQIDEDDIEEMDIKWNMALLSMRADRFCKKTRKKITIQGTDVAGFEKSKVECFNYHKMGHFARECRAPRSQDRGRRKIFKQDEEAPTEFALMAKSSSSSKNEVFDNSFCSKSCKKNTDSLNTKMTELSEKLSDSKTNLYHYKLGLSQVEARLVEFKTQEIKFCEKIRGLEFNVKNKNIKIENLLNELEQIKKEKEGLDSKLTGFESASKDLDTLLGSQRCDKNKKGLGYSAVPPPAQVYSSPKKDMSWR